jgi:hypothetical protein
MIEIKDPVRKASHVKQLAADDRIEGDNAQRTMSIAHG